MTERAPASGQILTAAELTAGGSARGLAERADVCIVGSGAGGAVMAAQLAERGVRVLVLEEGSFRTARDFTMEERIAYPQLYQEHGQRATADLAISILQGRALGGGTVVNWTTSFRAPDRVLAHWRSVHGVEGLGLSDLAPHFEAVERRLQIHEQPLSEVNANNRVLWDGAAKLGLSRALVKRNVEGCTNLGYCGMGCPIDAKMSMDQTYVRDAVKKGARFFADTRAIRIETKGKRAVAVHARVLDPENQEARTQVTIRPKLLVLSGGAINTPALLLRSKLEGSGRVGRRTFLHPTVASAGLFKNRIDGFYGAPQSVASHHFAERGASKVGFFLEAAPVHPMLAATAAGGFGQEHQEMMARLGHVSALIGLTIDGLLPSEEGGTVSLRGDGRIRVDYPIQPELWEALREANKVLAHIQLAAGAEHVYSFHEPPEILLHAEEVEKLEAAPWQPGRVALFSAHAMGGCAMGRDREKSVVDSTLKLHDLENVYVVDGSVFPTGLGVNPQETIFALAHWAAGHVAGAIR